MKRRMYWHAAALTVTMVMMLIATSYGGNIIGKTEIRQTVDQVASDPCDGQMPGDVDNNGVIDVQDATLLVYFLCQGGPAPTPLANADVNGDCVIDLADVRCLQDFEFCTPVECTCVNPAIGSCDDSCSFQYPGDVDNNGHIDIADLTYLVAFVFQGGPAPNPASNGDVDGNCSINIADITYLTAALFQGGPPPVHCTCLNPQWSTASSDSLQQLMDDYPVLKQIVNNSNSGMNFQLEQNHPNPFNPSTEISFNLAAPSQVTLIIYNSVGQKVRTLMDRTMPAGQHVAVWDGRDDDHSPVSSGIYLYKLTVGNASQSKRMLLMK